MENFVIELKDEYTLFPSNTGEQLELLKNWELVSDKAKEPNNHFLYKGLFTNGEPVLCKIIGYQKQHTIIVELEDGRKLPIHVRYLKDMQRKGFVFKLYADENAILS